MEDPPEVAACRGDLGGGGGWSIGGLVTALSMTKECSADAPGCHPTWVVVWCPGNVAAVFHGADVSGVYRVGGRVTGAAGAPNGVWDADRCWPDSAAVGGCGSGRGGAGLRARLIGFTEIQSHRMAFS
jgi:hypothetical protein